MVGNLLVDAAVGRGPTRSLVRVIVDTPSGDGRVKVDECAAVSRAPGAQKRRRARA